MFAQNCELRSKFFIFQSPDISGQAHLYMVNLSYFYNRMSLRGITDNAQQNERVNAKVALDPVLHNGKT